MLASWRWLVPVTVRYVRRMTARSPVASAARARSLLQSHSADATPRRLDTRSVPPEIAWQAGHSGVSLRLTALVHSSQSTAISSLCGVGVRPHVPVGDGPLITVGHPQSHRLRLGEQTDVPVLAADNRIGDG